MKILALVTDAYGGHGGIACFNRDLLRALSLVPAVTRIEVLPRHGVTQGDLPSAKLHQHGARRPLAYIAAALKLALQLRPQLVFCGHMHLAPLAAVLAALLRRPLWLQVHGIEAWPHPGRWQRWAFEQATLVTAVSRHTRGRVLTWGRLAPHQVRVLPNTLHERFLAAPARRLPRPSESPRLLTVGRLSSAEHYKGHEQVLRILPQLRQHWPRLQYQIAGDGDDAPRLRELVRTLGLSDAVHFLGVVTDAALPNLYADADVFVMPSTGEGFGIVFLEAAACGLPVVGLRTAGAWDALLEGQLGAAVPADDDAALIAAILAALHQNPSANQPVLRFQRAAYQQHVAGLLQSMLHTPAPDFDHP